MTPPEKGNMPSPTETIPSPEEHLKIVQHHESKSKDLRIQEVRNRFQMTKRRFVVKVLSASERGDRDLWIKATKEAYPGWKVVIETRSELDQFNKTPSPYDVVIVDANTDPS
jgi:hypothetical protein